MRRDNETAVGHCRERRDAFLDVDRVTNGKAGQFYRERRSGGIGGVEEADVGRCVWIEDESGASGAGCDLFEQLKPFAPDRILKIGESREVPAGARQACDESTADRIADKDEYDRYGARFLLKNPRTWLVLGTITSGVMPISSLAKARALSGSPPAQR
jgi:hypothetical protein